MKKIILNLIVLTGFIGVCNGQIWTPVGADINGEATGDKSGSSVSLNTDGTIMAIGAIENDGGGSDAGHVRIYQNTAGSWVQIGQDIDGEAAGDKFGSSVSLNGDGSIVAIGGRYNDGNGGFENGHVRIYQNISGTWTQIGQDIDGENGLDQFGNSVELSADGSIVAIGGFFNDDNGGNAGHVRIYQNISGTWTQIGQDIDGDASGDEFGTSLSLNAVGSIVAIGAPFNDGSGGFNNGHAKIYENISGTWTQIGQDIDGEADENESGNSISLSADGSVVAIGAIYNYDNGIETGHVRIYENIGGSWAKIGQDIDGEAMNDQSGNAISLSSDGLNVAIGAHLNDGNGNNSGHVRVYKLLTSVGIEPLENNSFLAYPNPTNGIVNLEFDNNKISKVSVLDNLGQLVMEKTEIEQIEQINLSRFENGVYIIRILIDHKLLIMKVVKQ
jgi:Flp pilus assembly pilin Flp